MANVTNTTYDGLIRNYAGFHNVRWTLLKALIQHESNFDLEAVGDGSRARGLCQMHVEASHDINGHWADYFDPNIPPLDRAAWQVADGAAYFGNQIKHFPTEEQALVAYNQGPGVAHNGIRDTRYKQGLKYAYAVKSIEQSYSGPAGNPND